MIAELGNTVERHTVRGGKERPIDHLSPDAIRVELVLGRSLVGEVTENLSHVAFAVDGHSLHLTFGFFEHPCLADRAAIAMVHKRVAQAFPLMNLTDDEVQGMLPKQNSFTVFARK